MIVNNGTSRDTLILDKVISHYQIQFEVMLFYGLNNGKRKSKRSPLGS